MKHLIIQSNHGNHTGFDRKWSIVARCDSKELALTGLAEIADLIADGDEVKRADMYNNKVSSFSDGLTYYYIISQDDYDRGVFDGGHMGWPSREIMNYFEN